MSEKSDSNPSIAREEIRDLLHTIKKAVDRASTIDDKTLSKIAENVRDIQFSTKKLEKTVDKLGTEITNLSQSLYEPDMGLYARVRTIDYKINANNEATNELCEDLGKTYRTIKETESKAERLEKRLGDFEKEILKIQKVTGGSDHDQLKAVLKTKTIFTRLTWAFVLAFFAGVAKLAIDIFTN